MKFHPVPSPGDSIRAQPRVTLAVLSMLAAAAIASLVHVLVRIAGEELPIIEVSFVRSMLGGVFLAPLLFLRSNRGGWRTRNLRMHAIRGAVTATAVFFWFYGLATIPLVQVVALSFSAAIFTTIGAALFLGEKVGPRRWSAVFAGLAGAMVILRPGLIEISPGSLATLLGSALWAVSVLLVKRLARQDGNLTIVLYTAFFVAVLSALPAAVVWKMPSDEVLWLLLGLGAVSALGQVVFTNALRHADVTVTIPADFTRLIWAALLGFLLFEEKPDIYTWAGGFMIVGASLYIAYRESRIQRRARRARMAGGSATVR